VDEITIPVSRPLTFEALRKLNPTATVDELANAFDHLPAELQQEAFQALRLHVGLELWNLGAQEEAGP
jgi:hypothetical protein